MARYFKKLQFSNDGGSTFKYSVVSPEKDVTSPIAMSPAGYIEGAHTPEKVTEYWDKNHEPTMDYSLSDASRDRGEETPSTLFGYTPSKLSIENAFFHNGKTTTGKNASLRSHVIPLFSQIAADYPKATFEASPSLSEHSSNLVGKAKKMGFSVNTHESNPNANATNDISFSSVFDTIQGNTSDKRTREIPHSDIEESMKPVRAQIRAASIARKENKLSGTQFPQTQLPGMESF